MTDRTMSVQPPAGDGEPAPPTQQEIVQLREEVARLRDLLVVRDTELGAARGRLTEMEQYSVHLTSLVHRVRGRLGAVRRLLGAPWRWLAGRSAGD